MPGARQDRMAMLAEEVWEHLTTIVDHPMMDDVDRIANVIFAVRAVPEQPRMIIVIKERFDGAGLSFPYPHQVSVEREPKAELPVRIVDAPAEGRADASARPDAPEE